MRRMPFMENTRVWWEHLKEGERFKTLGVVGKKKIQLILKI